MAMFARPGRHKLCFNLWACLLSCCIVAKAEVLDQARLHNRLSLLAQRHDDPIFHKAIASARESARAAATDARRTEEGLKRASTWAEMEQLFRDNLYPDMAPYQRRAADATLTGGALGEILRTTGRGKHWLMGIVAVRIKNGQLTYAASKALNPVFHTRLHATARELAAYAALEQTVLPDTLFLLNMHDSPLCPTGACPAPVFSLVKRRSHADSAGPHEDVLVPFLIHQHETLTHFPQTFKTDRAVLRAGIHRMMRPESCRHKLLQVAQTELGRRWLDVGITDLRHDSISVPLVPQLPLEQHARWRYLLSCDGNTASARLGKLLTINSLVLKEESPYIEFYYRSLRNNEHYIDFKPDKILEVLDEVSRRPEADRARIVLNAQRFAFTYLSQHSRILYFQKALTMYNELFGGRMPDILAGIPDSNWTIGSVKALK